MPPVVLTRGFDLGGGARQAGREAARPDRDAAPVSGLSVSATYHVRGLGNAERDLVLHESAPGRYVVAISTPGASRIDVAFTARRRGSDATLFEAGKSLVIP